LGDDDADSFMSGNEGEFRHAPLVVEHRDIRASAKGQVSYFANQLTVRVQAYPLTRQPIQLYLSLTDRILDLSPFRISLTDRIPSTEFEAKVNEIADRHGKRDEEDRRR